MSASTFCNRLFSLRFPHENNSQFASRIGQQITTVMSWKAGSQPRLSTIESMAKRLGVSREWLAFGTKPKRPIPVGQFTVIKDKEVAT